MFFLRPERECLLNVLQLLVVDVLRILLLMCRSIRRRQQYQLGSAGEGMNNIDNSDLHISLLAVVIQLYARGVHHR